MPAAVAAASGAAFGKTWMPTSGWAQGSWRFGKLTLRGSFELLRRRESSDHLVDVIALDTLVNREEAYAERSKSLEESLDVNSR